MLDMVGSKGRIGWVITYSACVPLLKPYKAILSPVWSPRVLNQPIIVWVVHTHQQYPMIHICPTIRIHSTFVERPKQCINSNWYRLGTQSIFHVWTTLNIYVTRNLISSSSGCPTILVFTNIRIFIFCLKSVIFCVLESRIHPSTITSLISIRLRAIN